MAVSVKFSLRGISRVRNLLSRYARAIGGNRAELHQRFGVQALNWIDRNFRSEGGQLLTGPWRKLSANTIAGRRRKSSKILQDTGRLRGSFTMQFDSTLAKISNADPNAIFHERGTRPYIIRPKTAKMLAFPVAGGGVPVTAAVRRRSNRFGSGGYRRGQNLAFAFEVHHPGLPMRRMLPKPGTGELVPELLRTTINFIGELKRRGGAL